MKKSCYISSHELEQTGLVVRKFEVVPGLIPMAYVEAEVV